MCKNIQPRQHDFWPALPLLLFFCWSSAYAQPGRVNESMVTSSSYGLYFRPHSGADVTLDNNGKNMFDRLDPASIPGPLYWNSDWAPANLYLKDDRFLGRFHIRLNLYNGLFVARMSNGDEKVVQEELVKSIRFDTVVNGMASPVFVVAAPPVSLEARHVPKGYLLQLTNSPVMLLRSMKSILLFRDSLFGAIRKPYFAMREAYHVAYKGSFSNLRKLSFRELTAAAPELEGQEAFFTQRRVRWSDENSVAAAIQSWNDAHWMPDK
ncbi:MAG: hypothetical protein FJX89_03905 [Bacteroidetes bacterium]|nr:hypothetical protein [Bacteroidota bacterium]